MVKAVYKAELLNKTSSKNMTCTGESITCSLLSKSSDARKQFLVFIFIQVSTKNKQGNLNLPTQAQTHNSLVFSLKWK